MQVSHIDFLHFTTSTLAYPSECLHIKRKSSSISLAVIELTIKRLWYEPVEHSCISSLVKKLQTLEKNRCYLILHL